jgi:hypothetical protein
MAAIPTSERFFAPEISKVYFATTLAAPATYTRTEVTASQDLTKEIAEISGFSVSSGMIDTPDLGSRFTSQIGGRTSVEASSITFYADKAGDDVREVLPRGTKGFLIFMDGGDVATQKSDVYPVEVTSLGKVRSTGDNAFQLTANFAVTGVPFEDVAIPAAV